MTENEQKLLELVLARGTLATEILAAKEQVYADRCPPGLIEECILEEELHRVALVRYREFLGSLKERFNTDRGIATHAMEVARAKVWPTESEDG